MTVTSKPTAAPAGELIRAWLPIPRAYPFQGDFEWVSSSSKVKHLEDVFSPIRCVHLEQIAKKNKPTEFKIEYNYTTHGVYFDVKPQDIQRRGGNAPEPRGVIDRLIVPITWLRKFRVV